MNAETDRNPSPGAVTEIEIRLTTLDQLFNSLDASPFYEKELDGDAEEYIVGSVDEIPLQKPLALVLQLPMSLSPSQIKSVQDAVRNHFIYRLAETRRRFRFQLREGRIALLIGLVFLFSCVAVREILSAPGRGTVPQILAEGLLILGWVAMWRPLQIFLYDWWPIRHQARLYAKLAAMPVVVRRPE